MNRYASHVFLLILALSLIACNGKDSAIENGGDLASVPVEQAPAAKSVGLPRIPNSLMQVLIDSTDYVDYLFYDMDFSMSMDNKQGVMYSLAKIGEEPASISGTCKPIGRVFYQIKGRNAAEADLYFSKGCTYLIFMKDNSPVYGNSMSEVGKTFLNNQFAAIMQNYQAIE